MRIKKRRVGEKDGESSVAGRARRWCTLMTEASLTRGHEPSINSRRNWHFVYIKSGADGATAASAQSDEQQNKKLAAIEQS